MPPSTTSDLMNPERYNMSDVMQRTEANSTAIALLKQSVDEVRSNVNNLTATINNYIRSDMDRRAPNYALWGICATVIAGIITAVWVILSLKISAEVYPIAQEATQNKVLVQTLVGETTLMRDRMSLVMGQNQVSIDDRAQLNKKMEEVQKAVADNRATITAEIAVRSANEREIETQFDADGQLRNTQFAEQQRMNQIIWNMNPKKPGKYPDQPFYFPNISRREGRSAAPQTNP